MDKLITFDSYKQWCDAHYIKGRSVPDGQVIFCNPEDIKYFFDTIRHFPERKIILVSAGSDFSVWYQSESPINADIIKTVQTIDYETIAKATDYVKLSLSTANYVDCCITDKFSVKIDRHTINTFNEIPKNIIKWFCANANINEPQVEFIPYGMNIDTEENGIMDYYTKPENKTKWVYANSRTNSVERMYLRNNLIQQLNLNTPNWLTFIDKNVPVKLYYQEMSQHYYTLCPQGNGLDSYRFAESLVVGTLPILSMSRWSNNAVKAGFLGVVVENLVNINYDFINYIEKNKNSYWEKWNPEVLKEKYWGAKIIESRKLLGAK